METGLNRLVVLGGVWYVVAQCRIISVDRRNKSGITTNISLRYFTWPTALFSKRWAGSTLPFAVNANHKFL
ncbi:hypothetical protein H5410_009790 [Solanum commersonii]|uniref:Uncharacterized protein n=1 Tax=Solanum commersonii TaxID=4109 RepID=A0A9J6AJR9_SOLCO|nr:hypothetical protein H5410_009790 [Solanum commersonii]